MATVARWVQTGHPAVLSARSVAGADRGRTCNATIGSIIHGRRNPAGSGGKQGRPQPRPLHPQPYGTFTCSGTELQFMEQEAATSVLVLPRIWCGFRRTNMKKLLMLAAAASLAATMANAQTTVTTTGAAPATVQIEPQYRTKIKTYVTEHKLRPVQTQEKIVVGAKVPSDVELVAVPSDWGPNLTKYRYVYSNDRVMLVDPGTRAVVQEVD